MSSIKPAFVNMEQRERINNIVRAAEHLEEVIKQNCPKGRNRKQPCESLKKWLCGQIKQSRLRCSNE